MKRTWKELNWDTWNIYKRIRHIISVILSIGIVILMWLLAAYIILITFGIYGYIIKLRDVIILGIIHFI